MLIRVWLSQIVISFPFLIGLPWNNEQAIRPSECYESTKQDLERRKILYLRFLLWFLCYFIKGLARVPIRAPCYAYNHRDCSGTSVFD